MNLFQAVANTVMGFTENTALPWVEKLFKNVEHDVVTTILPDVETALAGAGATAVKDLSAGDTLAATLKDAGAALAAIAPALASKAESVTLQDIFTAAAAAASNAAVAAAATPAPANTTAQTP